MSARHRTAPDYDLINDFVADWPVSHSGAGLPMMSAYLPMMTASALVAAGQLGLFEALADGPLHPRILSTMLGVSPQGLGRLINLLVEGGHLTRAGTLIANAPATMRWFTSNGEADYSSGLIWTGDAWSIMGDLSGAVRRGGPDERLWDKMARQPGLGDRFAAYMYSFAKHLTPDLMRLAPIPDDAARLLDLGGSHGLHSIAFCREYPTLSAVLVDMDTALTETQSRIDAHGLSDRIQLRPGDINDRDWGNGYDIALYLSVAHNMTKAENEGIFADLYRVMRPGGVLIIHDYPVETTPALFRMAFDLTLLVETGTRTFAFSEIEEMLANASFREITLHPLTPADKGALIVARKNKSL